MNNRRRAQLNSCESWLYGVKSEVVKVRDGIASLGSLKTTLDSWSKSVDVIANSIGKVETEEEEAYSSVPFNLSWGNTADKISDALGLVGTAKDSTEFLKNDIDDVEEVYIKSFLPSFNPKQVLEKLDALIDNIESAIESIKEARS